MFIYNYLGVYKVTYLQNEIESTIILPKRREAFYAIFFAMEIEENPKKFENSCKNPTTSLKESLKFKVNQNNPETIVWLERIFKNRQRI